MKVVNANNSASEQASQIESLIVEGWDAIVIDAASPTALNGVIQEACDAHIVVVVFDSLATAPCAYKVAYNYVDMGKQEVDFVAKRVHDRETCWRYAASPALRLMTTFIKVSSTNSPITPT